jgi:hypothetical protein
MVARQVRDRASEASARTTSGSGAPTISFSCASGAGGSTGRVPEQTPSLTLAPLALAPEQPPYFALASLARRPNDLLLCSLRPPSPPPPLPYPPPALSSPGHVRSARPPALGQRVRPGGRPAPPRLLPGAGVRAAARLRADHARHAVLREGGGRPRRVRARREQDVRRQEDGRRRGRRRRLRQRAACVPRHRARRAAPARQAPPRGKPEAGAGRHGRSGPEVRVAQARAGQGRRGKRVGGLHAGACACVRKVPINYIA